MMMNYTHKLATGITKVIASAMTIGFSFVVFVHGQSCALLPGWSPATLADGQSKTGYQVNEATYTQSCTGAAGLITCISGTLANGNILKYPSCIPHTWNNCTTPTTGNHLEYKTLFKVAQATYTQSCQQLSQSLQCLNGVFTGGITPNLYTFTTCVDPNRAQCVDIRTNSFRDHLEIVEGYTASTPGLGQTCATLKKTLTCTNGTWSGGSQAGLFTGCTDPGAFLGCANIWMNNAISPHGSSLTAYTNPNGNCSTLARTLTCVNGLRSGGNQLTLSSGCVQAGQNSCLENIVGIGTGSLPHGTFITQYLHPFAFETSNQYCTDFIKVLQCQNGARSGNQAGLYTGCQNVSSGSCLNAGVYTPNFQFIKRYTSNTATASISCSEMESTYTCVNGTRSGGTPSGFTSCGGCSLPRTGFLAEGLPIPGFSVLNTAFPKSCSEFKTILSCSGGILNGNWQTYKFPECTDHRLVSGIDLAIDESPARNGYIIAQGSSPEISILFKNNGTDGVNQPIPTQGFLSCKRTEQGINVYKSNALDHFVVNPGTKVGMNIRIQSIFTQAVGPKTLECKMDMSMINGNKVFPSNDSWSGTFEVVKADRFDLALSKSIEPISKNLEAAEGAKGALGVQNFLYNKIMNVLVPLVIILGILSAILGFYKIMFSSEDTATKEGTRYIIYGVIGIILIMSAKFIGQNVFDLLSPTSGEIKGYEIASGLYNKIIYPFIKFAIYLVLGAMFVILVSRVITFLFGSDADAQKKAGTLIGWNVLSMLIIIGAKQIVQAIYGQQANVVKDITNLGEIGSGVLENKNIPILYQVINYALGIASLVILVVIIVQTVKLLMKPDDPAQIKSIKNSLFYMLLGILVLGSGYLIVNFAIIN